MESYRMAGIYPGSPACSAMQELIDGRKIDATAPQYFTLQDNGILLQDTLSLSGCNGYSPENVALLKKYSTQQFVTISGVFPGLEVLLTQPALIDPFCTTILSFLATNQLTGVLLDFESFGEWTALHYRGYKQLLAQLGQQLHQQSFQLMIAGPTIVDTVSQGNFVFRWEEVAPLVDYCFCMAYDRQYDAGIGTPIAPLAWIMQVCSWMRRAVSDPQKIVIGLNSYGYHGEVGTNQIHIDTYEQSTLLPGFATATRDPASGEMCWTQAHTFASYSDATTLAQKEQVVLSAGITHTFLWHLGGGNPWFPADPVQSSVASVTLSREQVSAIVAAIDIFSPGYAAWYDAQGKQHG